MFRGRFQPFLKVVVFTLLLFHLYSLSIIHLYLQNRYFSSIGSAGHTSDEIGSYTLSRGTVGRRVFKKEWQHIQPRYPHTLQERWHRASIERLFHPQITEQLTTIISGAFETLEYRLHFESTALDSAKEMQESPEMLAEYRKLSPWHDIPLGFIDTNTNELLFNYINEISIGERAKMECATDEEWNPIKQDTKKGKLRFFNYGDIPFNYGFIPQTWEDPNESSAFSDVSGLGGDNDPIDVVEISQQPMRVGEVVPIKVLAVLGLIDEGETDWKIIGLRADHPLIDKIKNMSDVQQMMNVEWQAIIFDWFKNYKVPDGKPQNIFTHQGIFQDISVAVEIIEECHRQWYNLLLGAATVNEDVGKLSLVSIAHKHLLAQGLTTNQEMGNIPNVPYPRYDKWQAQTSSKIHTIDQCRESTEMDEETADQPRKS